MSKPIGYFTSCSQGAALTAKFGDLLEQLSNIDRAGLIVALGYWNYFRTAYGEDDAFNLEDVAGDVFHTDDDETTIAFQEAGH